MLTSKTCQRLNASFRQNNNNLTVDSVRFFVALESPDNYLRRPLSRKEKKKEKLSIIANLNIIAFASNESVTINCFGFSIHDLMDIVIRQPQIPKRIHYERVVFIELVAGE